MSESGERRAESGERRENFTGEDVIERVGDNALHPKEPEVEVTQAAGVGARKGRRFHDARGVGEIGAKGVRRVETTREIDGGAETDREGVGPTQRGRGALVERRPELITKHAIKAEIAGFHPFAGARGYGIDLTRYRPLRYRLQQLLPGALSERPERAFAIDEQNVGARLGKLVQDRPRREERIAAVVPFAHEHQHATRLRESADLTKILHHRCGHRATGPLHSRPFPGFVAAEKPGLERP